MNVDLLPGTNNTINLGNTSGAQFASVASSCGVFGDSHAKIGSCALSGTLLSLDGDANIHGLTVGLGGGSQSTNAVVGYHALQNNGVGVNNVAVGYGAMSTNDSGTDNVALGASTLAANLSGNHNVAIGYQTMFSNTSGGSNSIIGENAAYYNTVGGENVAIGNYAFYKNHAGSRNTVIGTSSLYTYDGTGNGYNTVIGAYTGGGIIYGSNNTIIGSLVGSLPEDLSNNIIIADGSGNRRINVISNGNTGIGVTAPTTALQVAGQITPSSDNAYALGDASLRFTAVYATNGTIQTSDVREKKDIKVSDLGLSFVESLRPVSYRWKNGNDFKLHYGLIAQETEKAIQDEKEKSGKKEQGGEAIVVHNQKTDLFGISYAELISPIIKAIQEISVSMSSVQADVEDLKKQNAELRARLDALERAH
jgi:hypothetical protein